LLDCDGVAMAGIVARLALGSVFLVAGLFKVLHKPDYRQLRAALPMGESRAIGIGLTVLPFGESLLGVWLLAGTFSDLSLSVAILLLVGFSAFLFMLTRRGYSHGCACFGSSDNFPIGPAHFIRNGLLLISATFALLQNARGCKDTGIVDVPIEVILMVVIILGVSSLAYRGVLEIQSLRSRA
jgi:hypothetical protein